MKLTEYPIPGEWLIPNATLIELDQVGYTPHFEAFYELMEALLFFID